MEYIYTTLPAVNIILLLSDKGRKIMYGNKGIITEDEQMLICRYPANIQEYIKEELFQAKEYSNSFSSDDWIECREKGLEIGFYRTDKPTGIAIDKPNIATLASMHDGRLEEFKQYPKGTRVKANEDIIY